MRRNDLFLFVRPPRPLWPFNGPGSAFWPPLGFASLAAALRGSARDVRVGILDAPALAMGWRSLEAELRRLSPAYVGIGEEAVSCAEGLRLAALAKGLGARVVAGGCFFGNVAPQALATGLIDVVAHGEGERTVAELLPALRGGTVADLRSVAGISFRHGEEVVFTGHREPVPDLDLLPLPAYDLLPVERYGRTSRNHPRFAAVELGRGCPCACSFCVLWRQMGRRAGDRPVPYLRTKSPDRLLEEVRLLVRRYGRRYLAWVDPCFNADPAVPARLSELLLEEGVRIGQSAWVRADCIVRDAASGALRTCVRAGLNEVYVGIERGDEQGLRALGRGHGCDAVREALGVLSASFPEVFTVGSFIYGLPGDTPAAVRSLHRLSCELGLDMAFFIPLTPLPGTPYWRSDLWDPTGEAFRAFSFLPHANGDAFMARLTRALSACFVFSWPPSRLAWVARGISARDARRRSIVRRHAIRGLCFAARLLAGGARGRTHAGGLRYPRWYES